MASLQRHERRQNNVWYVPVIGCVLLLVLVWFLFFRTSFASSRQTIVVVGSPMTLLSWDASDRSLTVITLPSGVQAAGTHGYGTYSLEAFWKLGEIDKKDGSVLAESLSEAVGIPVGWYIGPKVNMFMGAGDPLAFSKNIFSFGHMVDMMVGQYRTNIPVGFFMNMAWVLHVSRPERIKTFDFSQKSSAIAEDLLLPDGSHQMMLDPQRLDVQLKNVFEDTRARSESVTVAVYNTTTMPSLGNRVARLLGHLGVSVVTVGNDMREIDGCTLTGLPGALKSVSAQIIENVLKCRAIEATEADRADIIVRMGRAYEKRFLPN